MPQSPAVPAHAPLQPENVAPAAAVAVSVTAVPGANAATHVAPQLIPAGLLLTLPGPAVATDSVKPCCTKVAVTVVSAPSVTTQGPASEQPPPLQPAKTEPGSAFAVSVTVAPVEYWAAQVTGQPIAPSVLLIVPLPEPLLATVSVTVGSSKAAITVVASATASLQALVPAQPPPVQPLKTLPAAGVAVSVTTAPAPNV